MRARTLASKPLAKPATISEPKAYEVELARAVDLELDWFHAYAEVALRHGTLSMLPAHLAVRLLGATATEEATCAKALSLAVTIRTALHRLDPQDAAVLRATFTPRRWPAVVTREFQSLTPVVVRIMCALAPWPARRAHEGLETAVAKDLARRMGECDKRAIRGLQRDAKRLLGRTIQSYLRTRDPRME